MRAITVIGTNVVIDCETVEEAVAYMDRLAATPAPLDVLVAALVDPEPPHTCPSCGHDGLPPLVCEHCGHRWYATPAPHLADCGYDEPHEPHTYVLAENDRPVDHECPGLAATPAPLAVLYGFPKSYTESEAAAWIAGVRAATPAPLDVIAAVRKVFDSGARLKHKADDPTSSYDPLARETVVLAALRAALDGGPS